MRCFQSSFILHFYCSTIVGPIICGTFFVTKLQWIIYLLQIRIRPPNAKGRLDILKVHARKVKLAESVDLSTYAQNLPGKKKSFLVLFDHILLQYTLQVKSTKMLDILV